MRRVLGIVLALLCWYNISAQLKSGMIIQGGVGHLSNIGEAPGGILDEIVKLGGSKTTEYFFNASLGYKFRIEPANKTYFYDIDWAIGLKRINFDYYYIGEGETTIDENGNIHEISSDRGAEGRNAFYYMSINPNYNYRFYRKFSGGAGLEPMIYFKDGYNDKWRFDCPISLKVGYDLKHIGFSLNYKIGLFNIMKTDKLFSSGNLNDIQLQMFIPF